MPEKMQPSELCINCLDADNCGYRTNQKRPIIFCEDFNCTNPSGSENDLIRALPKTENSLDFSGIGICSNCENFEVCKLPKTEGDVINCEEYR